MVGVGKVLYLPIYLPIGRSVSFVRPPPSLVHESCLGTAQYLGKVDKVLTSLTIESKSQTIDLCKLTRYFKAGEKLTT